MSICNHYFPGEASKNSSVDEQVLITKSEELGMSLYYRSATAVKILFAETDYSYDILGTIGLFSEHYYTKMVFRERGTDNILLLIKGVTEKVLHLFEDEDEQFLAQQGLDSKYLQNLRKIIFGYKFLTPEQANSFIFEYNHSKLSPINIQGKIANVFEKYEKGLLYLGIIGIENPVTVNTKECIQSLTKAGIKLWIVTGESEESTLLACSSLGLFKKDGRVVKITDIASDMECLHAMTQAINKEVYHDGTGEDEKWNFNQLLESIDLRRNDPASEPSGSFIDLNKQQSLAPKDTIRSTKPEKTFKGRRKGRNRRPLNNIFLSRSNLSLEKVDFLKKIEPDSANFVLSVNSEILNFALISSTHRKKFVSLLFTAKCVIFYSMSPDQKILLVKLLKHNFSFRPLTLTIGNENTDIGMLDTADIGVSVGNLKIHDGYNPDIRVSDFGQLSKLILQYGHYSYLGLSNIFLITIYKQAMVQTVLLLFQTQSYFSGA